MKTNGLRNKKPATVRASWRIIKRSRRTGTKIEIDGVWVPYKFMKLVRWHRAAKGRK